MNINLAIKNGSKILRNKFITNSELDTEILMAKTINKDRNYILLNPDKFLNQNNLNYFFKSFNLNKNNPTANPKKFITKSKFS